MIRFIQAFNFLGVVVLAVLCCAQWQTDRQLNLRAAGLEKTRLEQVVKLAEQEKTIQGNVADLDDFRQRLTLSEAALKEAEDRFNALATERDRLVAERDQLKTDLSKWQSAVADRDAALKQAGEQLQNAAADRNAAVAKFNDLADKYNTLVKQVEAAQAKK